jgi:alpha-1,2-mannosyltransferase
MNPFQMFSWLYGFCGRCSDVTMVNGSWTEDHIANLWGGGDKIQKIYPPCDTKQFREIKRTPDSKMVEQRIVSLGQFRPEKDHALQIRAMAKVRGASSVGPVSAEMGGTLGDVG